MAIMTRLALLAASALVFASSVSAQAEDADGFVIAIAPPGYCKLFTPACAAVCAESYPTKKPVKATCQPAKHKKGGYRTRCMCGNINATKLARGRAANGSKGTPSVGPAQTITSTTTSTVTPTTISTVTEPVTLQTVSTSVTTSYVATTYVPGTDVPYALRKRTEGALEARAAKTTKKPTAKQTQTAKKTSKQTAKTTKITKSVKPTTSVPKVPASVAPGGTVTVTTVVTATAPAVTSMTTTSATVQTIYTSTTTSTDVQPLQTIASPNKLVNYDFEQTTGTSFASWIKSSPPGNVIVPDTTKHHSGSADAYIPAVAQVRYLYQFVSLTQGETYRYGCWFNSAYSGYAIGLSLGNVKYGTAATNGWEVLSTTFTQTAASSTQIFGGGQDGNIPTEAWMDSCFFYRIA